MTLPIALKSSDLNKRYRSKGEVTGPDAERTVRESEGAEDLYRLVAQALTVSAAI